MTFTYGFGNLHGPVLSTAPDWSDPAFWTTDGRYSEYALAILATERAKEEHDRVTRWRGKRIALVGCSARKGTSAQPALSLYRGDLFKAAVAWAQRHGYDVWILSAAYGLIHSSDVIEPYNKQLYEKTLGPWSRRVTWRFTDLGMRHAEEVAILAGDLYRRWAQCLEQTVPRFPAIFRYPLRGLGIGEQKAWLTACLRPRAAQRELFISP